MANELIEQGKKQYDKTMLGSHTCFAQHIEGTDKCMITLPCHYKNKILQIEVKAVYEADTYQYQDTKGRTT